MDDAKSMRAKYEKVETLNDLLNFIEDLEQFIVKDEDFTQLSLTDYFDGMQTEKMHVHPDKDPPYRLVARLLFRSLYYAD